MIDLAKLYARNHRDQQYMIVGAIMVALLGGLAPRYERALFVTGGRAPPAAFAAIAPPAVAFNGLFDSVGPYAQRTGSRPGTPVAQTGATPDGFVPVDPVGATPGGVSPVGGSSAPVQLASLSPAGRGITGGPLAGSGPLSFGPGANAVGPAGGGTPTTPPGGGGTVPGGTDPVTPVGPVPEPSTWAMLVLGFFGLGTLLRRRRKSVSSAPADHLRT